MSALSSCFQQTSISSRPPSGTVIQRAVVAGALHPATRQKEWLAMGSSVMSRVYAGAEVRGSAGHAFDAGRIKA